MDGTFDLLESRGGEVEGGRGDGAAAAAAAAAAASSGNAGMIIDNRCYSRVLLVDGQGLRQSHVQGCLDVALVAGLCELANESTAPGGPAAFRGIERHAAAAAAAVAAAAAAAAGG